MVRERLNAIDIAAVVCNLQRDILNFNLVNIYDVSNRIFILKFSKSENKVYLLLEPGHRLHVTQFLRSDDSLPSNFNAKLRKHLRTRKLRAVAQTSQDRIVDFTFSSGEHAYHLIAHFFPPGNIYMTDYNYKVLSALKSHGTGNLKVGETYEAPCVRFPWELEIQESLISEYLERQSAVSELIKKIYPSVHDALVNHLISKVTGDTAFASQCVTPENSSNVIEILETIRRTVLSLAKSDSVVPGYLFKSKGDMFDDFGPLPLKEGYERFEDFNAALDAFFTTSEIQKQENLLPNKPMKLKRIMMDQERREQKLENEILRLSGDIEILEAHGEIVDQALNLLKSLIASGASWKEITNQINMQREMDHPVARYIKTVDIANRCLEFSANDERGITLDYSLTCFQNLENFYSNKKKLEKKLKRTSIGKDFALHKVSKEKEARKHNRGKVKLQTITKLRKRFWFEKFHWFITSDGYLVLGGRDSTQNEILVKRYLTKGDLYFHADIHGAASCILKNPNQHENIPQNSIEESGCFSVCHSSAWEQKFSVPSWWVYHHQVSKTPPTGEYVPQGSFVIRGKKNYIQPQKLEMAIAIVFQIDGGQIYDQNAPEDQDETVDAILEPDNIEGSGNDYFEVGGIKFSELEPLKHSDDETNYETGKYAVRFDTNPVKIEEIETVSSEMKRTRGRKATGYIRRVDLKSVVTELNGLDINSNDPAGVEDPEEHEILQITTRVTDKKETTSLSKSKKSVTPTKNTTISRESAIKAAKIKKKYGRDDEETQEIRRMLTGSRKMKQFEEEEDDIEVKETSKNNSKPISRVQKDTLEPLNKDEMLSYMRQFENLRKEPQAEDVILSAVPMCAPYNSLKNHPYHVKLVPGNTKKGAIATHVLQYFVKLDPLRAHYIKLVTIDQLTLTLIGNCKISANCPKSRV